jgi:hypothetical protein
MGWIIKQSETHLVELESWSVDQKSFIERKEVQTVILYRH